MTVQKIAVPSYIYPGLSGGQGDYWDRAIAHAPTVDIMIANPNSGPGESVDANYTAKIAQAVAAGITMIGYIATNYTAKTTAAVQAEIDTYLSYYPTLDGVFLDETPHDNDPADFAYYQTLYDYIKAVFPESGRRLVVLNPGTATNEAYVACSDIIVTHEGSPSSYRTRSAASWEADYLADRFWHVVYEVADIAERNEMLSLSTARNAGYVYLTDDALPNPWDTIPDDPFWSGEVAAVAAATLSPREVVMSVIGLQTATTSNVSASVTSVTLLSASGRARGRTVFNDSTAVLYLKYGATASSTSYTVQVSPGGFFEFPEPCYAGRVDGIWSAANGTARCTEVSA